jgi:hypothetical protein
MVEKRNTIKIYTSATTGRKFIRVGAFSDCIQSYSGESITLREAKNIIPIWRKFGNPILIAHIRPVRKVEEVDPRQIGEWREPKYYSEKDIEDMEQFIKEIEKD